MTPTIPKKQKASLATSSKHTTNDGTIVELLSDQDTPSDIRSKGLDLLLLIRPLFKSKKHHKSRKKGIDGTPNLKSARKSPNDMNRNPRLPRKVSFSPSVDEIKTAREQITLRANTMEATDYGHRRFQEANQKFARRASFNDSIGRSGHLNARVRRSSLGWDKYGTLFSSSKLKDKRQPTKVHTSKQAAIANDHALALEQIIHAGSSLQIHSLDDLKAEREEKTKGKRDKEKVQMIPAVSPKRVLALKKALLDTKTAVGVINELQRLAVKEENTNADGSKVDASVKDAKEVGLVKPERKMLNHPVKAVCLNCTEVEADQHQEKSAVNLLATREINVIQTDEIEVNDNEIKEVSSSPMPSLLTGITPVTLLATPTTAAIEAVQTGTFDALATLSGVAVRVADSSADHTEEIHPPLDRMAAFIRWWGYEITLPPPSLNYLGTVRSVSSAVFTILTTMAITGGIPELLPFIRYLSSFVDMEFTAIRSQDKGHGVILAATWLMPMALVPRPWDYPTSPDFSLATPMLPDLTPTTPGLITHFTEEPKDVTVQA